MRLTDNAKCRAVGEEYQITHPTASINGLLRGSLWVAICDSLYITCRGGKRDKGEGDDGTRLRAIVEYKDESWISKAKYALEGAIYSYGPNDDPEEYTNVKQVPQTGYWLHSKDAGRARLPTRRRETRSHGSC